MRWLPLAALALLGCGSDDRRDMPEARDASRSTPVASGPDPIVLRVARGGGRVRAYLYPRLDSLIWSSGDALPPVARVLGFDESAGSVAVVDGRGVPQRVSLRAGSVAPAVRRTPLATLASYDGYGIYGVGSAGITRLTPSDARPWSLRLPATPRDIVPQADGSVLIVADRGSQTVVWRTRPPETAPSDSAVLPRVGRAIARPGDDRVYFLTDTAVVGVQARTLERLEPIRVKHRVRDAVATPSGDRLYLAIDSLNELQVVNRYEGEVTAEVELPGPAIELRMDPLGRYLLARAAAGDSGWVVAIGTDRVLGTLHTDWRTDLPLVLPDGVIATARGSDVVLVDGETLRDGRTVRGGANDFWHLLLWNGLRPRTEGADPPPAIVARPDSEPPPVAADSVTESTAAAVTTMPDSTPTAVPASDSAGTGEPARPTQPPSGAPNTAGTPTGTQSPAVRPPAPQRRVFTVQLAAVRTESAARDVVASVRASGPPPRIVATQTSGVTLYRVVLGPFASEREAERVGKTLGRDYWVYEGEP